MVTKKKAAKPKVLNKKIAEFDKEVLKSDMGAGTLKKRSSSFIKTIAKIRKRK